MGDLNHTGKRHTSLPAEATSMRLLICPHHGIGMAPQRLQLPEAALHRPTQCRVGLLLHIHVGTHPTPTLTHPLSRLARSRSGQGGNAALGGTVEELSACWVAVDDVVDEGDGGEGTGC